MPVIVVTRLRLKDPAVLDEFFTHAVAVLEQAMKSEGNLGADALAEASNTWWSVSAWQDRARMQSYVNTEPHLSTMGLLDDFCDEATFVDWEQDAPDLPDWQTSWRHLVADGQSATLTDQSDANLTRAFPAPVEPTPSVS
jgi:quinol monooxygenase YgiN